MEQKTKIFRVQNLALMAVLVAMQIILSRFAGIQINEGLRVSFESIPIILAGFWLGPISGMLVAAVADILGTIISGYGVYFPLLTVGPMLLAAITGIGARLLPVDGNWEKRHAVVYFTVVIAAECITSLLYGTWALTLYYSIIVGKQMPFAVLFAARVPTKLVTMAVDAFLSFVIYRAVYRPIVRKMLHRDANTGESREGTNL